MKKSTANISTLVAVGGSLVAFPAAALELGEAQINSSLGQPLRASIAYALAPNETLFNTCVSTQHGQPGDGALRGSSSKISIANGIISITGNSVVREPIISMRLNVSCPYAAHISREYTLFVDPAGTPVQVTTAQATASTVPVRTPVTAAVSAPATQRVVSTEPVVGGVRYQVQRFESLGDIAQRIVDRPVGLWAAADAIFAANPDAFVDNDPNKLRAGSWLAIPSFGAATASNIAPSNVAPVDVAPVDVAPGSIYTGTTPEQIAAPFTPLEEVQVYSAPLPAPLAAAPAVTQFIDIPDAELEPPVASSSSPNVATASVRPTRVEESSSNWLLWLVGAGVSIIALMLFFGRQVRNRFGASPIGEMAPRERRQTEAGGRMLEEVSEIEVTVADTPNHDDLEETQENLALDADLIIGSGLQEGSEIDVAQDFGFAATTELDLELPEEPPAVPENDGATDIIPPLNIEAHSILESEVMPDEEEEETAEDDTVNAEIIDESVMEQDEYDMSVIVDATKMPETEDVTMLDLEAVAVEGGDETLVKGDYTVSSEVDYTVLEQDYEDEFSATQALNEEIARAAEEIAESIGELNDTSMASVAALEITAQLPANNDDFGGDADSADISAADDADEDDITAKFRAKQGK